jgi:putative transposase
MWEHGRNRKQTLELPTIWEVPDDLWAIVEATITELDPPRRGGRPRIDQRAAFNAVIYRLRTGCQWNRLPKEFPNDRSVHRTFQRWLARGVLERVWAVVAETAGIQWERQVVDAMLGKARSGGIISDPIPPTGANAA